MPMHSNITQDHFLKVAQVFNWATKRHYVMWFTGTEEDRHRRIEILLKRLSDKGRLRVAQFGKKLVYIAPRQRKSIDNYQLVHGLGVTEGLVRFWLSDRGIIVPERKFKTKVRPEWGMIYGETKLLYEFCTRDNSKRLDVLKRKVNGYNRFIKDTDTVLFVMQITRDEVKDVIKRLRPEGRFLFTDLETFMSVPLGQQLTAKIYIWEDGNEYQLRPG